MRRTFPMLAWALAGILLIAGLTTAAVAATGKEISRPTSKLPFLGTRVEPAAGETPGSQGHGGKGDDHGSGTSQGSTGDDHGGTSSSSHESGSGSSGSGSGSVGSTGSDGESGDSGGDNSGEGGGGGDD